ncbi:MAG TPA: AAA family ATPase [Anaerolineae bacterium]|nr:AAA family ATPase [Anaerolineae bacterium]
MWNPANPTPAAPAGGAGDTALGVVIGYSGWQDISLMTQALTQAGINILALVSDITSLADQARSYKADCILFSPTLPGMNPALIQELLVNEEHGIAAVGLIPAGSTYAPEYQRFGMKGFVTTPLDAVQVQRLPDIVRTSVDAARSERAARTFTPITAQDALAILDSGGWQQQSIGVFSPKGGAGKSTVSVNLACALGTIAQRPTLLIDGDMSRANSHVFLGMEIDQAPQANLFSFYERVVSEGTRVNRYVVRAQTLQMHIRPYQNKLAVLPGIPQMHMAGLPEFTADMQRTLDIFADLLREARGYYEFRVVDIGPDFNMPIHWAALSNVDTVLLVVTPERTALSDVHNILPALEKAFGTLQRFRIVLNGFDEAFGIAPKDVVKYLGGKVPVVATLPWDPNAARLAINQGQPLTLQKPLTELGEGLIKLAATFYPPLDTLLRKRPVKKGGLFSKVKETFVS